MKNIQLSSRHPVGRPPRGPKKRVRTSFTLRPDDVAWLAERAAALGQSKSETLEACLALAKRVTVETREAAAKLVEKYPSVYWDVSSANIQGERHAAFVIERMLENGTFSGVQDLLLAFPRKRVAEVVASSKRISRRTALFWKYFLGIEEPIHCLKEESRNPLSKLWE